MDSTGLIKLLWRGGFFGEENLDFFPEGDYVVINRGMPLDGALSDFSGVIIENKETGQRYSGGVKIDSRSSDWRTQQTIGDPEYDNIMVHLVANHDCHLVGEGTQFLSVQLTPSSDFLDFFSRIPTLCTSIFAELSTIERTDMVSRLVDERIRRKTAEVISIYTEDGSSWQNACHIYFFRVMGMPGRNKSQFESIARAITPRFFELHYLDFEYTIATVLGVLGLLDYEGDGIDDYTLSLRKHYELYNQNNTFEPISLAWGSGRFMPFANPSLTLVRAVAIIYSRRDIFEVLIDADELDEVRSILSVEMPEYWRNHYSLSVAMERDASTFSSSKVDVIIINFLIPILFAKSTICGDE